MRAALLSNTGFTIEEIEKPKCEAGSILVQTKVCGICEGDLHRYRGALQGGPIDHPLIGHEGSGIVVEIGAGVKTFAVGDRVADLSNGTYSEYFLTTPSMLARIPDGLSFEDALGEPVACFVHASGRFGIQPGDRVAVLGCGFMGIGCIQMARLEGAGRLVAFDPIPWRRVKALAAGADEALDTAPSPDRPELSGFGEFDVVIEAAGVQGVIDMATNMVREHGRIVFVGYHQSNGGVRSVDMKTWNYKALDIVNGHVRRTTEKLDAMTRGLRLVEIGTLDLRSLTTIFEFQDIADAFSALDNRKEGLFKAVLKFG